MGPNMETKKAKVPLAPKVQRFFRLAPDEVDLDFLWPEPIYFLKLLRGLMFVVRLLRFQQTDWRHRHWLFAKSALNLEWFSFAQLL